MTPRVRERDHWRSEQEKPARPGAQEAPDDHDPDVRHDEAGQHSHPNEPPGADHPRPRTDLHAIVRLLPDVIFECEKRSDGKIYWNYNEGKLAEEFGVTTRQIEGKSLEDLFPGGASHAMRDHFEAAFRGEVTEFVNEMGGRYFRHKPQPVFDDDGNVVHVVGFITEVTGLQKAQLEIQSLTEELTKRLIDLNGINKELETFNYTLSHDLRNPLSIIDLQAHLLHMDLDKERIDKARERLRKIQRESHVMNDLIEDILGFTRIQAGEMERKDVDLSMLASQLVDDMRTTHPGRKVDVEIEPGMVVQADPGLVRQVLQNLLGNAWKYTGKREQAHIRFSREATADGGPDTFVVADNGAGFEMQDAGKVFQPFMRLHKKEEFTGTGVGLATVAKVIARHGGQVWCRSEPDKGATFFFTLGPHEAAAASEDEH